jgi:hypothetical protein
MPMKPLRDFIGQELRWVHPRILKREYEFYAGDELIATLGWPKAFSSQALAEAADGRWIIKREGFFQAKIVICPADEDMTIATIKRGMSGKGALLFADGRGFKWASTSFWRGEWGWFTDEGMPLLRFRRGKRVEVEPQAFSLPEISLFVLLGFYLVKVAEEEAAAAASTTVVVSS